MIELPLIFVAGFLGSSHCIGMCGPFAMLLGSSRQAGIARQLIYSTGRLFTYSVLGAIAGSCGIWLAKSAPEIVNVPAGLSVVAGCFLIYQGLSTAGVIPLFPSGTTSSTCLAGGLLASFLRSRNQVGVFLAGVFTGFLPCGLVYGFVGMAAGSRDIINGALIMAAFGIGTVPIMVATGIGGGLVSSSTRGRILRVAAWCVVLAGVVSILRGLSFFGLADTDPQSACPLCN